MNAENINDLVLVNQLAKDGHKYRQLCYAIKDALLDLYGTHRGFCVQEFTRDDWEDGSVYSWHRHILEIVQIGEDTFHRPTQHFHYEDIRGAGKESPGFAEARAACTDEAIFGEAKVPVAFDRQTAIRAMRRLVHEFFKYLRDCIPKQPRTLYPFVTCHAHTSIDFSIRYYLTIRVPEHIVVCSGCGRKLNLSLDRTDCENEEVGLMGTHPERLLDVRCDSQRFGGDCSERIKDIRGQNHWSHPDQSWRRERTIVADWARKLVPEYLSWRSEQLGS